MIAPPPMAWPCIAAIAGFGKRNMARIIESSASTKSWTYFLPRLMRRGRSTPAEKIEPVPVMTIARTSPDSADVSKSRCRALQSSRSSALAFPWARRRVRMPSTSSRSIIATDYIDWTVPMKPRIGQSLPDVVTVTAIALIAYAAPNVLHEAFGHGGACMLLGGKPIVLSSVHFECGDDAMSALARRGVAAAGTIANFVAGAGGLMASNATNPGREAHVSYFLWLFTTLN